MTPSATDESTAVDRGDLERANCTATPRSRARAGVLGVPAFSEFSDSRRYRPVWEPEPIAAVNCAPRHNVGRWTCHAFPIRSPRVGIFLSLVYFIPIRVGIFLSFSEGLSAASLRALLRMRSSTTSSRRLESRIPFPLGERQHLINIVDRGPVIDEGDIDERDSRCGGRRETMKQPLVALSFVVQIQILSRSTMRFFDHVKGFRHAILTLLVALAPSTGTAVDNEAQGWFLNTAQGPMGGKWRLYFEAQPRIDGDGARQLLIRPAIGYQVTEKWSLWQGYAWTPGFEPDRDESRIFQQSVLNSSPFEVPLRFVNRTRLEQRWLQRSSGTSVRLRHMLRATYPLDAAERWSVAAYDEAFATLNRTSGGPRSGFDQNRAFAGINCKLSQELTIEVGYVNQFVTARRDTLRHIGFSLAQFELVNTNSVTTFDHSHADCSLSVWNLRRVSMSLDMTRDEREAFLADRHIGIISIANGDQGPLTLPIWYMYEPGGELTFITDSGSHKARLLAEAKRFSLCAQSETVPYKYVSVEGPITSTRPAQPRGGLAPPWLIAISATNSVTGTSREAQSPGKSYSP